MRIYFLALFLLLPLASAMQFSPAALHFTLSPSEKKCQDIFISADSLVTEIADKWSSNTSEEWSAEFTSPASASGLTINYPEEVEEIDKIPICISGTKPGKYRGVLLLRQEEVGNSVIQIAIWLDVTITDEPTEDDSDKDHDKNSGSRGSRTYYTSVIDNSQNAPSNFQQISYESPEENIQLNEKTSEARQNELTPVMIFAAVLVIILIVFLILFLLRK